MGRPEHSWSSLVKCPEQKIIEIQWDSGTGVEPHVRPISRNVRPLCQLWLTKCAMCCLFEMLSPCTEILCLKLHMFLEPYCLTLKRLYLFIHLAFFVLITFLWGKGSYSKLCVICKHTSYGQKLLHGFLWISRNSHTSSLLPYDGTCPSRILKKHFYKGEVSSTLVFYI